MHRDEDSVEARKNAMLDAIRGPYDPLPVPNSPELAAAASQGVLTIDQLAEWYTDDPGGATTYMRRLYDAAPGGATPLINEVIKRSLVATAYNGDVNAFDADERAWWLDNLLGSLAMTVISFAIAWIWLAVFDGWLALPGYVPLFWGGMSVVALLADIIGYRDPTIRGILETALGAILIFLVAR